MMSNPPGGISASLADWAASVDPQSVPLAVRRRSVHLLIDAIASALAGRHGDETGQVEAVAHALAPGDAATVIGGGRLSPLGATLLNGYQVTAVTVCDVYRPALCHVTPEIVPPALAAAEVQKASGRDLLAAVTAGLETTARIGRAIRYAQFRERGWHAPGVIGPFGGAVAAGRLLGLSPRQMRWAFGLAGSQAAGTFAQWGTPTIKFHQARGAAAGLLAATLAREDFPASERVLEHEDGGIFNAYSDGGDPDSLVRGLGEEWELDRISLRLWPTASSIQSAISAVFDLINAHDLVPDQVRQLTITLSETTYKMHGEMEWDTRFKALLSTRYTAAVVLHDRECWLDQFEASRIADPVIGAFARERIRVVADGSMPTTAARADAELTDGRVLSIRRDVPKGDADDPLSEEEIADKFRRAAEGLLPDSTTERVLDSLLDVEQVDDASQLIAELRRGS
jgi:2-methylcitrate dehydratase PrpD